MRSNNQDPPITNDSQYDIKGLPLEDAVDEYIEARKADNLAGGTINTHRSRLSIFVYFLASRGLETTDEIHPRHFTEYKQRRSKNLTPASLDGQLDTVTVFIRTLEQMLAVKPGLSEFVPDIDLDREDERRTEFLDVDVGNKILEQQRTYNYANVEHVIFELIWATTMRISDVRALDVEDYNQEHQMVLVRHRPDTETPLKNGTNGQRPVSLPDTVAEALDDYLANPQRPSVTDDHGRNPIITTKQGRMSEATIRNIIYRLTQPCHYSGECPHDKDPLTCEAATNRNKGSKCPSSLSPHPLRRGAITRQRKRGISRAKVSQRSDVSSEVIEKHYEQLTDEEIVKARRNPFDEEYDS